MFSFNNFQRGSAVLQVCDGVWSLCKSCAHSLVVSVSQLSGVVVYPPAVWMQ